MDLHLLTTSVPIPVVVVVGKSAFSKLIVRIHFEQIVVIDFL
jgi:hypothetical protein